MSGSNGARFYLSVTSRTENDLSACMTGTPIVGSPVDLIEDPKYGPRVDQRCVIDPADDPSIGAIVGVYSPGTAPSKAAAHEYCVAHHGTNPE